MIIPFYKNLSAEEAETTLEFDSVFESGNLALAMKVADNEYNLLLQNDINTNGHPSWKRSCSSICYIQNKYTNEASPNGLFSI